MVTCTWSKKPSPLKRAMRVLEVVLNFVFKPIIIVPVAAFVAGFCVCLILSGKWEKADKEYIKTLEECNQALMKGLHNGTPRSSEFHSSP